MPRFSHFYSTTEEEAAASIIQLFPQGREAAAQFSKEDAEQLACLLDGTAVTTVRQRYDSNQPLFRTKPPVQSIEELLKASTFSVVEETIFREKPANCENSSDDSQEWKTRSRTPSSDEPSPQKYRLSSPTLSVKVEVSSVSDESENELSQLCARPLQVPPSTHASC